MSKCLWATSVYRRAILMEDEAMIYCKSFTLEEKSVMLRCRCIVMHIIKHLFIKIHFNKMSIFYIVLDCGSLWMMICSGNSHISWKYCGITGCIVPIDQEIYCCYLCPSDLIFLVEKFFWFNVHVICMFHSNYVCKTFDCIKFIICFAKKQIIIKKKYIYMWTYWKKF